VGPPLENEIRIVTHTAPPLSGTLPVRPFTDRFYGHFVADKQRALVAALAYCGDGAVLLSAVGHETTLTALFATFFEWHAVTFEPADDLGWRGAEALVRLKEGNYRKFQSALTGTVMKHYACLPLVANLQDGFLHPVEIPEEAVEQDEEDSTRVDTPTAAKVEPKPRYLLGNAHEDAPNAQSFMGALRVLRVITLKDTPSVPSWVHVLWRLGYERELIRPISSLGVKAWEICGDIQEWKPLVSQGVRSGELQWRRGDAPAVEMDGARPTIL
jgi:hypothetical protein